MKVLKSSIIISLLFLFTVSITHQSLNFLKKLNSYTSVIDNEDMNSDEQDSESEKSNEKTDSKEFAKDFFHYSYTTILLSYGNSLNAEHNINYSSADYSQVVYSPPEQL